MIETQEVTFTEKQISKFICNKCKKQITSKDIVEWQELFSYSFTGGWGSVFGDMATYRIDLCQNCFKEILGPYLEEIEEE